MTTDQSGVFTLAGSLADPGPNATASDHLSDAREALIAALSAFGPVREEMANAVRCIGRSSLVTGADRCANNAAHDIANAVLWIEQAITDIDARIGPRDA